MPSPPDCDARVAHNSPSEAIEAMTQSSLWQPSDINNADAGGAEQEAPKRRGRIPQSAWPHILERHRSGATLSAIAREFDCTPSAISYIVRKAEASGIEPAAAPEPAPVATEPQAAEEAEAMASAPAGEAEKPEVPAPVAEAAPVPVTSPPVSSAPASSPPARSPVVERPEPVPTAERRPPTPEPVRQRADGPRPENRRPAPPETVTPASAESARSPASTPREAVRPAAAPAATPQPARAEPSPPVDAVEQRLRDTARSCLVAYRGWKQTPNEGSIQALHDAVHDLRKALARIEIDMSASRRDEQAHRPIPIPVHRASRSPRG
jgi:transposase-like protein